jgi:hypothetical protein
MDVVLQRRTKRLDADSPLARIAIAIGADQCPPPATLRINR